MRPRQPIPPRASAAASRRWKAVLGLATVMAALTSVSVGLGEPKSRPNGPMGHQPPGKPPPGGKGGFRDQFGGGGPEGQRPGHERHERGAAGAAGMEHRHHGGSEAMQKRLDELKQKDVQGALTAEEKQELDRLQQRSLRRQTMEQRRARFAELQQKQASGKLTAEEKAELDQAQQVQARYEAMAKRFAEMAESRKHRSREAKRQALKEFPKLGKGAAGTAEYQKHAERLAKLERAKELANADGRSDVMTKIDGLISLENQRHQAWLAKQSTAQGAGQ